jgi:hypothetical protein
MPAYPPRADIGWARKQVTPRLPRTPRIRSNIDALANWIDIPSAYSSNGDAFASHNTVPNAGEDIETQFPLDAFPAPGLLWVSFTSMSFSSIPGNSAVIS